MVDGEMWLEAVLVEGLAFQEDSAQVKCHSDWHTQSQIWIKIFIPHCMQKVPKQLFGLQNYVKLCQIMQ